MSSQEAGIDRSISRGDLSDRLVHLTRGKTPASNPVQRTIRARQAVQNFWSIVQSGKLIAGTGGIVGDHRCVCFSEAPIAVLAQMLAPGDGQYAPLGVMVDKVWLFDQGGRPVIYQPRAEYDALPASHRYRHVNYDPVNAGRTPARYPRCSRAVKLAVWTLRARNQLI